MPAAVWGRVVAVLLICAGLFGLGWVARGIPARADVLELKAQWASDLKLANDVSAKLANEALWRQSELEEATARVDALQKGMDDEKATTDDLRRQLAAGHRRVLVRATCPAAPDGAGPASAAATAGVDHEAGRAQLDDAVAERLFGITSDGDAAIRQLGALQQYVREVCQAAVH